MIPPFARQFKNFLDSTTQRNFAAVCPNTILILNVVDTAINILSGFIEPQFVRLRLEDCLIVQVSRWVLGFPRGVYPAMSPTEGSGECIEGLWIPARQCIVLRLPRRRIFGLPGFDFFSRPASHLAVESLLYNCSSSSQITFVVTTATCK